MHIKERLIKKEALELSKKGKKINNAVFYHYQSGYYGWLVGSHSNGGLVTNLHLYNDHN